MRSASYSPTLGKLTELQTALKNIDKGPAATLNLVKQISARASLKHHNNLVFIPVIFPATLRRVWLCGGPFCPAPGTGYREFKLARGDGVYAGTTDPKAGMIRLPTSGSVRDSHLLSTTCTHRWYVPPSNNRVLTAGSGLRLSLDSVRSVRGVVFVTDRCVFDRCWAPLRTFPRRFTVESESFKYQGDRA